VAKFLLHRKIDDGPEKLLKEFFVETTRFVDKNITPGKKYLYSIQAVGRKQQSQHENQNKHHVPHSKTPFD